jgi:hypothetical protein
MWLATDFYSGYVACYNMFFFELLSIRRRDYELPIYKFIYTLEC